MECGQGNSHVSYILIILLLLVKIGYRVLYRVYQPEAAAELYSDLPQSEEFAIVEMPLAAVSNDDQRDGQIEVQLKGLKKYVFSTLKYYYYLWHFKISPLSGPSPFLQCPWPKSPQSSAPFHLHWPQSPTVGCPEFACRITGIHVHPSHMGSAKGGG
jgi:hypothetical protein